MNYEELGLKIGLEIHQQLEGKKLFCNCNTNMNEQEKQLEITRKLRASAGEMGEIDIAAQYEQKRDRTFIYSGYDGEYCLVDTDEEPPHEINKEALKTSIQVAKLLKLSIPNYLCVMRKTISDGSACSSFQRTLTVGMKSKDSFIKTSKGNVRLYNLGLEEDACKIIKKDEDKVNYSLSRQGIPLLELTTEPDIKSPVHAKETAEKIGLILRSFPTVKRGLGTIRQDLNLSIKGGARVEIKGFQDIKIMPKVIENEINRQLKLTKQGKRVTPEVRKANEDGTTTFLRPMPGAARLYPDTDLQLTTITKKYIFETEIPELITDKIIKLEKEFKLSPDLARELIKSNIEFKKYADIYPNIEPKFIANVLVEIPKEIKSRYNLNPKFKEEDFNFVLRPLNETRISKEAVMELLVEVAQNKKPNIKNYMLSSDYDLEKDIEKIIRENQGASLNALMGEVMKKYRGSVDGSKVKKILEVKLSRK